MKQLLTFLFQFCFPLSWLFAQNGQLIMKDSSLVAVEIPKKHESDRIYGSHKADYLAVTENGQAKIIYPHEVIGFTLGKKIYKSLEIKAGERSIYLFAEQLQVGLARLFYYTGYVFGEPEVYIFRKNMEGYYYISLEPKVRTENQSGIQTEANNPAISDLAAQAQYNQLLHNWSDERAFQANFLRYFSDCPAIVNKLKQDWYHPSMISGMFKDYNSNCSSK